MGCVYIYTANFRQRKKLHGKVIVRFEAMHIFVVQYEVFQFMCGANVIIVDIYIV